MCVDLDLPREELIELAEHYGLELVFDAFGLGGAASVVETLLQLADLIAADNSGSDALEKEARAFLIEDSIALLTATL